MQSAIWNQNSIGDKSTEKFAQVKLHAVIYRSFARRDSTNRESEREREAVT